MIKYFLLAFNIIIAIIFFFLDEVSISVDAPPEAAPGSEIIVTVTISKGSFQNFLRYQQELPIGIKAKELESKGGDFQFDLQKIKIIWWPDVLPVESDFTIQYTVQVDKTFRGKIDFGGMINYVDGSGNRQSIEAGITKTTIINGDGYYTPSSDSLLTDVANPPIKKTEIRAEKRYTLIDDKTAKLNIKIYKGDLDNFMKYNDSIPTGCEAIALDTKGGIFKAEGREFKILWNVLPPDSIIEVEILVTSKENGNLLSLLNYTGRISYMFDDAPIVKDLIIDDNNIAQYTQAAEKAGYKKEDKFSPLADKTPKKDKNGKKSRHGQKEVKSSQGVRQIPEPEKGIRYKVQICALQKYKDAKAVKRIRKYSLGDNVELFSHQGWYKYTVGSFNIYNSARDYRETIWHTSDATDAFVAAYNNSIRITVQEGLMLSNEPWRPF
ncbi:MAG: hypothetical protein HY738_22560 [Bacteroidia bacterium]|nr:hypothetical protein [Bacteroidia bacterium]